MECPDRYSPLFLVDERNGDILWELWIEAFEKAVKLRPGAWQKLLDTDAATAAAMRGMITRRAVTRAPSFIQLEVEPERHCSGAKLWIAGG